jgi:hypothetical protein
MAGYRNFSSITKREIPLDAELFGSRNGHCPIYLVITRIYIQPNSCNVI